MVFAGYGQSAEVRIGLSACLSNSSIVYFTRDGLDCPRRGDG